MNEELQCRDTRELEEISMGQRLRLSAQGWLI